MVGRRQVRVNDLDQAKANTSVVTSQLIFHSYPLYVLIYYDATHILIAWVMIVIEAINIEMPNKDNIFNNQMLLVAQLVRKTLNKA